MKLKKTDNEENTLIQEYTCFRFCVLYRLMKMLLDNNYHHLQSVQRLMIMDRYRRQQHQ